MDSMVFSMDNGNNNWGVGYTEICFFERVLRTHQAVSSFERINDIQFVIERTLGMSGLNVVFVSEYRLGEAFALAVLDEFPDANVIVNNGNWNAVVLDRSEFKANTGVDVLMVKHFMGALNNASFGG